MTVTNFDDLYAHVGCDIECVVYGNGYDEIWCVALECNDHNEVLLDFEPYPTEDVYVPSPAEIG